VEWQVADSLRHRGLGPGDTGGVLGQELRADYWARLAQIRVVADLPEDALDSFWQASAESRLLSTMHLQVREPRSWLPTSNLPQQALGLART